MRALSLGLFLSLVLAAPAQAKEVLAAKVCGANGCATSRDRDLIAGLAEGGDPVDPPQAAAPLFRVRLTVGDDLGNVAERFWTHFMPKGELIRGDNGTWMVATDAYTGALKKVVDPSMTAYPASELEALLAGDLGVRGESPGSSAAEPPRREPRADGGGSAAKTIGLAAGGTLAVALALLLVLALRRRRIAGLPASS